MGKEKMTAPTALAYMVGGTVLRYEFNEVERTELSAQGKDAVCDALAAMGFPARSAKTLENLLRAVLTGDTKNEAAQAAYLVAVGGLFRFLPEPYLGFVKEARSATGAPTVLPWSDEQLPGGFVGLVWPTWMASVLAAVEPKSKGFAQVKPSKSNVPKLAGRVDRLESKLDQVLVLLNGAPAVAEMFTADTEEGWERAADTYLGLGNICKARARSMRADDES